MKKLNDGSTLVTIAGDDYKKCVAASENYWSSSKRGLYGSGILNSDEDPHRTERIGLLGELAVAKLLGLDVDFSYKEKGDAGYDLLSKKGNKIAVKTAARNYGIGLVRCKDGAGKLVQLKADIYVFAYVFEESTALEIADICIAGWMGYGRVIDREPALGRVFDARWMNFEVPYPDLLKFPDSVLEK